MEPTQQLNKRNSLNQSTENHEPGKNSGTGLVEWRSRRCRCCLESQRLLTGSFNFAMNDRANVLKQFISKQVSTTKIAQKDG